MVGAGGGPAGTVRVFPRQPATDLSIHYGLSLDPLAVHRTDHAAFQYYRSRHYIIDDGTAELHAADMITAGRCQIDNGIGRSFYIHIIIDLGVVENKIVALFARPGCRSAVIKRAGQNAVF